MVVLGNIFRNGIIEFDEVRLLLGAPLSDAGWSFSNGVTKPYSGRGTGHGAIEGHFEFSKQVLAFADRGSYFFKAAEPESIRIDNWRDFQEKLIIKFTQTLYSFRELYIVVDSVTTDNATLAISGADNGELEIASDTENFGLVDIFGHYASKTIQSKEIEYYHRSDKRTPSYFKAKKLVVQREKEESFINSLLNKDLDMGEWADNFFSCRFHHEAGGYRENFRNARGSLLDMLQANELNANTALLYFKWEDANLDDVELLFQHYDN